MTDASAVLISRHDGWADLTLNRPATRNAIDMATAEALADAILTLEADATVRAIVLHGANGAFCSGLDLQAIKGHAEGLAGFAVRWDRVHAALIASRKVWIVALERHAVNGGAALALAADLLVCGEGAFMQIAEIRIGMNAPRNIAWLALRHGEAVAARLCLLGERVPATELLRLGVATEVVADGDVLARARDMAAQVGGFPAETVQAVKGTLRAASARMAAAHWFDACRNAEPVEVQHG